MGRDEVAGIPLKKRETLCLGGGLRSDLEPQRYQDKNLGGHAALWSHSLDQIPL